MSHNLNSIVLELNAAQDLVDRETFATVFAIHNRYAGKDDQDKPREKAIPISVLFGANTINLARKTIRKGAHFAVSGELDYDSKDGPGGTKEFFTIRASQLMLFPRSEPREQGGDEAAGPESQPPKRRSAPSRP